jgi:hypothetical protein
LELEAKQMLDNYQDLIDELLGTPQLVREMIAGGNPEALRLVLAMRTRDRIVLERLQRIKNQIDPYLKPIPPFEELLSGIDPETGRDELLATFENSRGDLVSILMNLTLRDWERTATTDAEGTITLADEVESHVEFDEEQRARLAELVR